MLLIITINVCLCPFNFGFSNAYFNAVSFRDIVRIFGLPSSDLAALQGLLTGCLSLTGGLGARASGYLLSSLSRRHCFCFLCLFMLVVCGLLMVPSLPVLLLARCLQGFCIGMISAVTPIYLREFSPTELASSLCPWNQIGVASGLTFSFILTFALSLFLPPEVYWRIVFGFPVLPSLLLLYNLHFTYPYETPKWLLLSNRIT